MIDRGQSPEPNVSGPRFTEQAAGPGETLLRAPETRAGVQAMALWAAGREDPAPGLLACRCPPQLWLWAADPDQLTPLPAPLSSGTARLEWEWGVFWGLCSSGFLHWQPSGKAIYTFSISLCVLIFLDMGKNSAF